MNPRSERDSKVQRLKANQGEGPNWVLVLGGALLSTLSIRIGYKLRQVLDGKQRDNADTNGSEKYAERRRLRNCRSNSSLHSFGLDDNSYYHCASGERVVETKNAPNGQNFTEPEGGLPLVTVPTRDYGMVWVSSPERGDLRQRPYHESNTLDSPGVSESGSDIFSKREVIQKLRQQLKRRDDMILEMQDQIAELQTALSSQVSHSNDVQLQLDSANRDLFDSEREIQKLRKAIADHCLAHGDPNDKRNGHANGFSNGDSKFEFHKENKGGEDRIESLRKEIGELKEVLEGKEFLLQSYKEEKFELSTKLKELQLRLDSQLPLIL
ncbi:uncharacterized protein LOC141594633 [Silene latifolia]|uniref:uncharacterized protein LOC141594633 n=1 Tax=Silene latifolia TaxID=37657 RepID=UPI003D781A30